LLDSGNVTSVFLANSIYGQRPKTDSPEDYNGAVVPVDVRFVFNVLPEHIKTEKNFLLMIAILEMMSEPLLESMVKFLSQKSTLQDKVNELKKMDQQLDTMLKTFRHDFIQGRVSHDNWSTYVQAIHGWGIDGLGGPSGSQSLFVIALDSFLGITGKSELYKLSFESLTAMTHPAKKMAALLSSPIEGRFSDPQLVPLYERLVKQLVFFRSIHLRRVPPYLAPCEMSASGRIDFLKTKITSFAELFIAQSRHRIAETIEARPVPPLPGTLSPTYPQTTLAWLKVLKLEQQPHSRLLVFGLCFALISVALMLQCW